MFHEDLLVKVVHSPSLIFFFTFINRNVLKYNKMYNDTKYDKMYKDTRVNN